MGQSRRDWSGRPGQNAIIQVEGGKVQRAMPQFLCQRLQGSCEKKGAQRVTLLDATCRVQSGSAKPQRRCVLVAPGGPPSEGRKVGRALRQELVTGEDVEGILEVKLAKDLVRGVLVAVQPRPDCVEHAFCARRDSHSNLRRPEIGPGILLHHAHQTLPDETSERLSDGNGANAALWLWDGNQLGPSNKRSGGPASTATRQQIDHSSELIQEAMLRAGRTSLKQVLRAKSGGARSRAGREAFKCSGHGLHSYFWRRGQVGELNGRWWRLDRVQRFELLDCLGRFRG